MKNLAIVISICFLSSAFVVSQKWYKYENEEAKMSVKYSAPFEESVTEKENHTSSKKTTQVRKRSFLRF